MNIKSIKLKNFQLFQVSEFSFDKINIIEGVNLDDLLSSSNGAGKSTIAKNAITFALYGDVSGINIKELMRIGAKEAEVNVVIQKGTDEYRIIRTIPSGLKILRNGEEVQGNTNTIKQKYIDDIFGTYDFFKKFRMIDSKGINLLDLGITSLRKELMNFVDTMFANIRIKLLNKKNEREIYNVDKRYYRYYLSEKKLIKLEEGLKKLSEDLTQANFDCMKQYEIIGEINSEISSKDKIICSKKYEIAKLNKGNCPLLNKKCAELSNKLYEVVKEKEIEINNSIKEIEELKDNSEIEKEAHEYYKTIYNRLEQKRQNTLSYINKLKEAFKFKDYKYTSKDVALYAEAIKVLDSFSGHYIENWLNQLSIIINDLLKNLNLQVEFSSDKNFIKIKNLDKELNFEQLSSGQKCFLSAIFKLAILLHRGESEGIIIADEGLGSMDSVNFKKFIEICKMLPFQFFIIYHGNKENIEDINKIKIERKNGVSYVV